jgi:hypothetical protein
MGSEILRRGQTVPSGVKFHYEDLCLSSAGFQSFYFLLSSIMEVFQRKGNKVRLKWVTDVEKGPTVTSGVKC